VLCPHRRAPEMPCMTRSYLSGLFGGPFPAPVAATRDIQGRAFIGKSELWNLKAWRLCFLRCNWRRFYRTIQSIRESCLSNRIWGAASVVGGAMELIRAAALFLAPEPTTVTKIAGGVLAVHGADTASAGLAQVVSCQTRTTLTSQAPAAAAKALGADPATASHVALAIEVAVPMAAGFVGAARAVAIRQGAVSLAAEEALGGHTIARHVGRTEAELRLRLVQQPAIPAASTFLTLMEAEGVVGVALRSNKGAIKAWAAAAVRARRRLSPMLLRAPSDEASCEVRGSWST
jgi:CDI toxin RNase A-like protein